MSFSTVQLIKDKLAQGFSVQNLYEMAQICDNLAADAFGGPAFYILRSIFLNIAGNWSERAVSVDEATEVEKRLDMPIREVLEQLESRSSKEALFDALAKVIVAEKQAMKRTSN